jgi:hypothetical protein
MCGPRAHARGAMPAPPTASPPSGWGDGLNDAPCPPFTSHGASIILPSGWDSGDGGAASVCVAVSTGAAAALMLVAVGAGAAVVGGDLAFWPPSSRWRERSLCCSRLGQVRSAFSRSAFSCGGGGGVSDGGGGGGSGGGSFCDDGRSFARCSGSSHSLSVAAVPLLALLLPGSPRLPSLPGRFRPRYFVARIGVP